MKLERIRGPIIFLAMCIAMLVGVSIWRALSSRSISLSANNSETVTPLEISVEGGKEKTHE
jgi:hypothetical protein